MEDPVAAWAWTMSRFLHIIPQNNHHFLFFMMSVTQTRLRVTEEKSFRKMLRNSTGANKFFSFLCCCCCLIKQYSSVHPMVVGGSAPLAYLGCCSSMYSFYVRWRWRGQGGRFTVLSTIIQRGICSQHQQGATVDALATVNFSSEQVGMWSFCPLDCRSVFCLYLEPGNLPRAATDR